MENKRKWVVNFALSAQALFWVVLFVMLVFSFVNAGGELGMAIRAGILLVFCHILNFYLVYSWLTPRYFETRKYGLFTISIFLLLLLLTPFRLWIENHFIHRPFLLVRGRRLSGLVIFSEVSVGTFAFLFRMAVDSQRHIERASEAEKWRLQTELKFLKFQMHPHFLFNTINNVYSLSLSGSDKTPEALLKLSGLLRYLLYECNQPVPFSKEILALEAYIDLFQLRFEQPLNIRLQTEVRSMQKWVEPMLLIPLLENAVKHSDIGLEDDAYIDIHFHEDATSLYLSLRNSKPAFPRHPLQQTLESASTQSSRDPLKRSLGSASMLSPQHPPQHPLNHALQQPQHAHEAPLQQHEQDAGGIGLQNIRKRLEMLGPVYSASDLQILEDAAHFEIKLKIPWT